MSTRGRQAARSLPVLIDHPIAPGSAGGFFRASPWRRPPALCKAPDHCPRFSSPPGWETGRLIVITSQHFDRPHRGGIFGGRLEASGCPGPLAGLSCIV